LSEKAREGLWITAKVSRRKNIAVGRTRTIYFEEEPGRRSAAKLLTKDDRRAFASKRGKKHSPAMLLAHFVGDARSREPLIRTGLIEALDY
jgi:hypothetical protein